LIIYYNKLPLNKMSKTVNCLREDGGYFEVISQIQNSNIFRMAYKTKV